MAHNEHGDHASFAHPAPMKMLVTVFVSLVGLTILTVVMNELPLGSFDILVAMIIATVKASLVALFFMHMLWDKGMNIVVIVSSLLFVALFIGMTLLDRGNYIDSMEALPYSMNPPEEDYLPPPTE